MMMITPSLVLVCSFYSFFFNYLSCGIGSFFLWMSFFIFCLIKSFNKIFSSGSELFKNLIYFISILGFFSFLASSVFAFFILVEMCSFLMIMIYYILSKDSDKINSLIFMICFNLCFSSFFIAAVLGMKESIGLIMDDGVYYSLGSLSDKPLYLLFSLMLLTKVPIYLMHFWLPKAHVSGGGICSIILASVLLKLGGWGLLSYTPLFGWSLTGAMLSLPLIGSLHMLFYMTRSPDFKMLIASSSIVHMGLIFPCTLSQTEMCYLSSMIMMVGHGFISGVMFVMVTNLYESCWSRSFYFIKSQESTAKMMFFLNIMFILLNLGLPPTISFMSEVLFMELFMMKSKLLVVLYFLILLLGIVYTIFLIMILSFNKNSCTIFFSESVINLELTCLLSLILLLSSFMLV